MDRLDNLSVFVAVAANESFAATARQLNRSAAAVTRAVATLEDMLQVRLFNRTTRAVSLTEAGARALETARQILDDYEELDTITEESSALRGVVGVTAPTMFGRLHVLPLLKSFLGRHPGISVRMMLLDRIVSLVDEGLDLAVRIGSLPDSSLRAIRVGSVQESVFGSPEYLAASGAPETPRELARHSIISCTTVTPVADHWTFAQTGPVPVQPRLIVNTTEAAVDASVAGLGLSFIVSYQAARHVKAGRLVRVLKAYELPAEPVQIVHPAGRHLPARIRLLLDHLSDGLRRDLAIAESATD